MSKENLEQFVKQVTDSAELQEKIGKEITGDALVALGAAHGCEFSIEDLQAGAELNDAELEAVKGGAGGRVSNLDTLDLEEIPAFKWDQFGNKFLEWDGQW